MAPEKKTCRLLEHEHSEESRHTAQIRVTEPEKGGNISHTEGRAPPSVLEPKMGTESVCLGEAQHGGSEP